MLEVEVWWVVSSRLSKVTMDKRKLEGKEAILNAQNE
jgi:hypothetical protein